MPSNKMSETERQLFFPTTSLNFYCHLFVNQKVKTKSVNCQVSFHVISVLTVQLFLLIPRI